MSQALQDIKILDLTQAAAGPYCTMLLSDLGAEVTKIEVLGRGDLLRNFGPPFANGQGAYFLGLNRNKKSMTLNLKKEKGKEIFTQLAKSSDVLVENFRPGTMEKWGLEYEKVKEINPDIIYCRISGYGQTGPYSERPGYDILLQGETGLISVTGNQDRPPGAKCGVALVDLTTGLNAVCGILSALLNQETGGEGQVVDVSLFDSSISLMLQPISSYLTSGEIPGRLGTKHPVSSPYGAFKASDSYITLGINTEKHWKKFCEILGAEDLADNSKFDTGAKRVENREELETILNDILSEKKSKYWLEKLKEAGLPCAPVNTVDEVVEHDQIPDREMLVELDHPEAGEIKVTGTPFKFSETPTKIKSPPPLLGQHTEEILSNLGYSREEIEDLKEQKII